MILAGLISDTSSQYIDFVGIFNALLDLSTVYLLALVDVELLLCIVVTLS